MVKVLAISNNQIEETNGDVGVKAVTLSAEGLVEAEIESGGGGWQPHPDWIDIGSVNDNEINLLVSDGGVGIAFAVTTSSGTYSIDWGDGTVETSRASGTTYSHQYTIGSGQSVDGGQYTVFKIRIYGATGNITRFQMMKHPSYTRVNYAPVLWAVFGTTAITTYANTFYTLNAVECRELQACTITSFVSCTSTSYMFYNCYSLYSITLPTSWGSITTTSYMFYGCYSLSSITLPTSWGSITTLQNMFQNCSSLASITLPSSWGSVTNVSNMFPQCYALSSITLPSSWGSITTLQSMFQNCSSLASITLPSSWGSVTNTNSMFLSCYSLASITLPSSWGSITDASYTLSTCYSLRTLNNLNYLGHQTTASDFTDVLRDVQALEGTLTIPSKLTKIGINGASGHLLKCTGIRLTNGANTWTGSSPQVNVSYTSLNSAAIETLFGDLEAIASKTIDVTGCSGSGLVSKTSCGTTTGSTTVTQSNTSSLAIGMEVYRAGLSDARAVTFQGTADTVTRTAHGIPNGKQVSFSSITTTTGISVRTVYYVINATADTFQVSLTQGGAAIDLVNDGSGNLIVIPTITTINTNTNVILDVPATTTASATATFSATKRSIAIHKGWTVIG